MGEGVYIQAKACVEVGAAWGLLAAHSYLCGKGEITA
jgi:hypothetical protein